VEAHTAYHFSSLAVGAAGLWIGWEEITQMLLIASCSALVISVARVPFGPFLDLGTMHAPIAALPPVILSL
jgi:hypothetical protein